MSQEPLTNVVTTIRANIDFLWDLIDQSGACKVDMSDRIQKLSDLNAVGEYESWMRGDDLANKESRYNDLHWWIAHAIHYNQMTLSRIRHNKFKSSQIDKIFRNCETRTNKSTFKNQMVSLWITYCNTHNIDRHVFKAAIQNGVDMNK